MNNFGWVLHILFGRSVANNNLSRIGDESFQNLTQLQALYVVIIVDNLVLSIFGVISFNFYDLFQQEFSR